MLAKRFRHGRRKWINFDIQGKRQSLAQCLGHAQQPLDGEPLKLPTTQAGEVGSRLAGACLRLTESESLSIEGSNDPGGQLGFQRSSGCRTRWGSGWLDMAGHAFMLSFLTTSIKNEGGTATPFVVLIGFERIRHFGCHRPICPR
jgi:hypothetical protein